MSPPEDAKEVLFKPGAIKRIRMTDFMTYQDCEYHLSPALNMVIGANGTGKSSVIAAICLGLGFDAKIMGRAEAPEMVRHGCPAATVEIELKGHDDHDPVLRRHWTRDDEQGKSKTDWQIDGKKATHKAVNELVRSYRVQIDNLCQFLPQDKVKHFSALTPQQLLPQTLSTIGDGTMGATLQQLCEDQEKLLTMGKQREREAAQLKVLQSQQAAAQNDVNLFLERQALVQKNEILTAQLPFVRYNEIKREKEAIKPLVQEAKEVFRALKEACGPLDDRRVELESADAKAVRVAEKARREYEAKVKESEQLSDRLVKLEGQMRDYGVQRKSEQAVHKKHLDKKRAMREELAEMRRRMGAKPDHGDEIKRLGAEVLKHNDAMRETKFAKETLEADLRSLDADIKRDERSRDSKYETLKKFSDVRQQRMHKLKSLPNGGHAHIAADWLSKNADKFDHPVAGPMYLDVEISKPQFKAAATAVLNRNAMLFVCGSRKDYNTFNRLLVDGDAAGQRLRLHVTEYSETSAPTVARQEALMPREELAQYGFDCVLLDCVRGPELLLNALCHIAKVHRSPVAVKALSPQQEERVQNAKRDGRYLFDRYVCDGYETRMLRQYGKFQTSTEPLRAEKVKWHEGGGDEVDRLKKQTEHELAELQDHIQENMASKAEKLPRYKELKEALTAMEAAKKTTTDERNRLQTRQNSWNAMQTKEEGLARKLDQLENEPATVQDRLAAIKADQVATTAKAVELALTIEAQVQSLVEAHEKDALRQVGKIQAAANKRAFTVHTRTLMAECDQAEQTFGDLRTRQRNLSTQAKAIHEDATKLLLKFNQADRELLLAMDQNVTEADIHAQIEENATYMSHISVQSGDTIEKFNERQRQIDALTESVENKQAQLDKALAGIMDKAGPFKQALLQMVRDISSKFSASFKEIKGQGAVELVCPEDAYNKWALEISVGFYESSGYSKLDPHRQSGGERAVSTVFFLMALQSLTIAPFRVVDEINQGMDPRNERLVHQRMVRASCEGDNISQYFLITPKLLPGLAYHRLMKVHCVTSGHLGQRGNKLRGQRYLEALKERSQQMRA